MDRRYDIQEARLGQHLAGVFDASNNSAGRGSSLARWNEDGSRGCLGAEVRKAMRAPVGVRVSLRIVADFGSLVRTGD